MEKESLVRFREAFMQSELASELYVDERFDGAGQILLPGYYLREGDQFVSLDSVRSVSGSDRVDPTLGNQMDVNGSCTPEPPQAFLDSLWEGGCSDGSS